MPPPLQHSSCLATPLHPPCILPLLHLFCILHVFFFFLFPPLPPYSLRLHSSSPSSFIFFLLSPLHSLFSNFPFSSPPNLHHPLLPSLAFTPVTPSSSSFLLILFFSLLLLVPDLPLVLTLSSSSS